MAAYFEEGKLEFRVEICPYSTSPNIQKGIWAGQHICVSDEPMEYFGESVLMNPKGKKLNESLLPDEKCGEAVIKHQLQVAHFGVLNQAFVKFNCYGFPHSTIAQITRHHDSHPLVASMRYTGQKFINVSRGELESDRAFYVRPPGTYYDRSGNKIEWTADDKFRELEYAAAACDRYAEYVTNRNMPFEMAREFLPYCYRQPFCLASTVEGFFHWIDQRSLKNAEREIQILAKICMEEFAPLAPQLHDWYMENRWSKAKLAP